MNGERYQIKEAEKVPAKEENVYKTTKYGDEGKPQKKVIKKAIISKDGKTKEIEKEIPNEEIIEKGPETKIIRKKKVIKGKKPELEELPNEEVI